jgi:hypothetical protein
MYKENDVVLVRSVSNKLMPKFHVKLIKREVVKAQKGNRIDWPAYIGWECVLTNRQEADILRKEWGIPFRFPNKIETFVFEEEIVRKVRRRRKRKS